MLTSSEAVFISIEWDIADLQRKEFLFVISLIGITIQDSGKKERSDVVI